MSANLSLFEFYGANVIMRGPWLHTNSGFVGLCLRTSFGRQSSHGNHCSVLVATYAPLLPSRGVQVAYR